MNHWTYEMQQLKIPARITAQTPPQRSLNKTTAQQLSKEAASARAVFTQHKFPLKPDQSLQLNQHYSPHTHWGGQKDCQLTYSCI